MTEIQNSKQLDFDLILELDIVIWDLFGPILRSGGACNLLFPVYPSSEVANPSGDFLASSAMN